MNREELSRWFEERFAAVMAGLCPTHGARLVIVGEWARCPVDNVEFQVSGRGAEWRWTERIT